MAGEKKQSFVAGSAILSASTLLVKILGLLFSIPLANVIDDRAMSYFYTAYDIFGVFLVLSTAGLPVAVSRMVGTAYAQGRQKEADRVFSVAFWLFFTIGLLGCLAMFFGAVPIAEFSGNPRADKAVMALAPTMFFISIMSALRGYFQGRSNMVPTAVSQIIEATTKVFIGVGLAAFIISRYQDDAWAAVGAITGVSISAGLGTLYLVCYKLRQNRLDKKLRADDGMAAAPRKELLVNLIRFAVPITLGSCFLSLLDFVDSAILMDRLQNAAGFTLDASETLKGVLGHARKFFDLPGSFVVPISTSLLPVLSGAVASKDQRSVDHITSISMRITLLISIPASVGMCLFSSPICQLLLANKPDTAAAAAPLLATLSLAIAFSSTLFTTNAILQSFGKPTIPVLNMAIGGVVKIAVSYVLIGFPEINAMGSAISTVVSYLLIVILNLVQIRRLMPHMDSTVKTALPMLLSALVMGAVSYAAYFGLCLFLSPKVAVVPAILLAVVVYGACAVLFRAVTYDDVVLLPKGETLARLLRLQKHSAPRHMR